MIKYCGYISEYNYKDKIVKVRQIYNGKCVFKAHWYTLYSKLPPERRIQNFLIEDYEIQALAKYIVLRDT